MHFGMSSMQRRPGMRSGGYVYRFLLSALMVLESADVKNGAPSSARPDAVPFVVAVFETVCFGVVCVKFRYGVAPVEAGSAEDVLL
jgi:hypothetical protein